MRARWLALVAAAAGALVLVPAEAATAHPLGNFSVNQLGALSLYPDRVELRAVVDLAELPTLQERSTVETAGPSYADGACAAVARGYSVSVGAARLSWTARRSSFSYAAGAAGLSTSRLTCELSAPAKLDRPATVAVENTYLADRMGWRELTAAGFGVRLIGAAPPARSVSDDLRAYPEDLLASPLDARSARFDTAPGADVRGADRAASLPAAAAPGWIGRAEAQLRGLVGDRLTVWVGALAVLLAIVLGAAHAALPGHGKTVMAMYLAGRAGRPRDALVVGATVTLTHTGGVIAVGLLLTGAASIAGERVLGWLGLASGALVAMVGAAMLRSALRDRRAPHAHEHDHRPEGHHHHGEHGHHHHGEHRHHHHGEHGHDHRGEHGHGHGEPGRRPGRLGLAGIGIAGGLVPSPSALVVLLGAIGLGRTLFGLVLVLAYGIGMAGTLIAAGLLLLRVRDRWVARVRRTPRRTALAGRLAAALPGATAGAVLLLGTGIAVRAAAGVLG